MKNGTKFFPTEVIFSVTQKCNLHCEHCYVSRSSQNLDVHDAQKCLESCTPQIEKIGFTGGEPFLFLDFILQIVKTSIQKEFLFDRIMTNGLWWQNVEQLQKNLQALYDSGFDGKIGLSFDSFHSKNIQKVGDFIKNVLNIFGPSSLEIQTVIPFAQKNKKITKTSEFLLLRDLSDFLNAEIKIVQNKKGSGFLTIFSDDFEIPIFVFSETLTSEQKNVWKSKKWFKEDFCEGPGHILYVHTNGNIAPCCGFSNENEALFIGNVKQLFPEILENAQKNKMIKLCFEEGLSSKIKILKKQKKLCGKTDDICTFCDFYAKSGL